MTSANRPGVAYADTNVFVALFADADHPLHGQALDLFRVVAEGSLRLIVTPAVVAELAYVSERLFGWRRATIAARFEQLLDAEGLDVWELPALKRALGLYRTVRRLDFVDAYLAGSALAIGPATVASLDRDFDRVPGVRRISAT